MCTFINCKRTKGVDFCADCKEFPCQSLHEFKSKMPHRIEIFESQSRMKAIGVDSWLVEMHNNFSCPVCKIVNSAYHLSCRKCGNAPGSIFASKYKDLIDKYLTK